MIDFNDAAPCLEKPPPAPQRQACSTSAAALALAGPRWARRRESQQWLQEFYTSAAMGRSLQHRIPAPPAPHLRSVGASVYLLDIQCFESAASRGARREGRFRGPCRSPPCATSAMANASGIAYTSAKVSTLSRSTKTLLCLSNNKGHSVHVTSEAKQQRLMRHQIQVSSFWAGCRCYREPCHPMRTRPPLSFSSSPRYQKIATQRPAQQRFSRAQEPGTLRSMRQWGLAEARKHIAGSTCCRQLRNALELFVTG